MSSFPVLVQRLSADVGCLRQSNPFLDDPWHLGNYLPAEKHLVNIAHVEHIDDTAQV
ncbi:MAG: hypothetical protein ACLP9L_04905 [Thermoguttaceae bacterium]